jgi:hypothetical protein
MDGALTSSPAKPPRTIDAELLRDKVVFPDPAAASPAADSEADGHATVSASRPSDPGRDQWPPNQIKSPSPASRILSRILLGESLEAATWRLAVWTALISALAATMMVALGF